MTAWSRNWDGKKIIFTFFLKSDPLREIFLNSVPKGFIATRIDMLRSNFVKLGQQEIGKIYVAYLTKSFAWLTSSRYCADRAQNLPGSATDNVLRVLRISSKSVNFRLSDRPTIKTGRKVFPIFTHWQHLSFSYIPSRLRSRFAENGLLKTMSPHFVASLCSLPQRETEGVAVQHDGWLWFMWHSASYAANVRKKTNALSHCW